MKRCDASVTHIRLPQRIVAWLIHCLLQLAMRKVGMLACAYVAALHGNVVATARMCLRRRTLGEVLNISWRQSRVWEVWFQGRTLGVLLRSLHEGRVAVRVPVSVTSIVEIVAFSIFVLVVGTDFRALPRARVPVWQGGQRHGAAAVDHRRRGARLRADAYGQAVPRRRRW